MARRLGPTLAALAVLALAGCRSIGRFPTIDPSDYAYSYFNGFYSQVFQFNPAVSFVVNCKTQREVESFWQKLSRGGKPGQCGWLTDKFGLSWQIVPTILNQLIADKDPAKSDRVREAMLGMVKIDIAELQKAHAGR